MYIYSAYNHQITSQIKLPLEAFKDEGFSKKEKINIHLGSIASDIVGDSFLETTSYFIGDDTIYVEVPSIARYLVTNRSDIVIEPHLGANETLIGFFLVYLVLVFVIKEKNQMLFHGSAFTLPDSSKACIFLGNKGAGKSTLAAAFTKFGCKVLCDDLIPVTPGPVVQPGIPMIKLFKDSYKAIIENENLEDDYLDGQGKFHIKVDHTMQPAALNTICIIKKADIDKVEIKKLTGGQKIRSILPHIIKISQIDTDISIFKQLLEYSNSISVFSVIRPEGFTDPHLVAIEILKKITEGELTI
jgi:hypothetical protein